MAKEFDVIFVDPMFNSNKKLKRTQQMEFLDNYLEEYDDPSLDFYETKFQRMVVKKELRSLCGIKAEPAISLKGSSVRYDVYLNKENNFSEVAKSVLIDNYSSFKGRAPRAESGIFFFYHFISNFFWWRLFFIKRRRRLRSRICNRVNESR